MPYDPQYGWYGNDRSTPLPADNPVRVAVDRAASAIFSPGDPRERRAAASEAAGQDPRFRFNPDERVVVTPVAAPTNAASPSPARPLSGVIHEAGYRPDSFPEGDIRAGLSIDRSRGTSGLDWARNHTPGDREVVRAPSEGVHTQGELEGIATARRMLDAAYGSTSEPFDPVEAQVESLEGQARLKLAERRAEDPVGFARMQADIPAQAQSNARLSGGLQLAHAFEGFDQQMQTIEQKRAAMHASQQYQAATPQARAEADARLDGEKSRIGNSLRVFQQAMGFATGQTPATLYAEQPGG